MLRIDQIQGNSRYNIHPLLVIALVFTCFAWFASRAQAQACALPATVNNEDELNAAIACYNSRTTGEYQITLGDNILLSASTTEINNGNSGVRLVINGETHSVDGQRKPGVRPFMIAANTVVTMRAITVTGGFADFYTDDESGGAIRNTGTLSLLDSTIRGNTARNSGGGGIDNDDRSGSATSTIISNAAGLGGGIYNGHVLTISASTIRGNTAGSGGGIQNVGPLTISASAISSNTAD